MSASLSVAALPPLPSAALDVRAPSGSKEHQSATADDSGDGDEDDAALNGLWAALVDDLLQEIHLDLCVQLHKEARTKGWTPSVAGPLSQRQAIRDVAVHSRIGSALLLGLLCSAHLQGEFQLTGLCPMRLLCSDAVFSLVCHRVPFVGTQSCSRPRCTGFVRPAAPNAQARRANLPLPIVWT
jgi:hypothetical protein